MTDYENWPRRHRLRSRLASDSPIVATFVQIPHPMVCEVVGHLGFDALCIDAEHTAIDRAQLELLVAAIELTPAAALVRVQGNDPHLIAAALDAGASGVIVPRIGTAEEASAAVAASRYPPTGERGFGPGRASGYRADPGYLARANDELLVGLQVETRAALENLDEILAVDDVDLIFVGPGDLGVSLGLAHDGDELRDIVAGMLERAHAAGRRTGIFAATPVAARRWLELGVDLVMGPGELFFAADGAAGWLAQVGDAGC
jgi:4-hydroxy-2-oxoheptanedioate aldolase